MTARSPANTAAPRRTVLYVEDDAAAIDVARAVTTKRGLVLTIAADMHHAMSLARHKSPEVMLINIDLADVGAASLVHLLRANPATHAAPVLALGSDTTPQAAIKALEAGFFLYLGKPMQPGPLDEALDYALEFSALERAEL